MPRPCIQCSHNIKNVKPGMEDKACVTSEDATNISMACPSWTNSKVIDLASRIEERDNIDKDITELSSAESIIFQEIGGETELTVGYIPAKDNPDQEFPDVVMVSQDKSEVPICLDPKYIYLLYQLLYVNSDIQEVLNYDKEIGWDTIPDCLARERIRQEEPVDA